MRELSGCGLHVEVHDGTGEYALFVHGILSSRAQWLLNLEALSKVCRPVVVELLGHGRSPAPEKSDPYTPEGYAATFEEIRDALDAERWFVVGQSLGAALTLRYTLDHPERVIAQVFTNSASALADSRWQERTQRGAPAMANRIREGGASVIEALPIHPAKARRMREDVKEALLIDAKLIDPYAIAMAFLHTVPGSSVRSRVGKNRVPTLLAVGTREESFGEPLAYARENMPKLEVVEMDAGHAVNIGAAPEFNEHVSRFIERSSG